MNSSVIDKRGTSEMKFPKLMRHLKADILVLFSEKRCGMVVFAYKNPSYKVSDHSTQWNMEHFEDVSPEIDVVLNNKEG